ncbi:hypothetical protein HAX54_048834, partial [Datura stramonium]|nr:hypothetical protein [Datura stramonium]
AIRNKVKPADKNETNEHHSGAEYLPHSNVVVAQDGSGCDKTIQEALNAVLKNQQRAFVIPTKAVHTRSTLMLIRARQIRVLIGEGPNQAFIITVTVGVVNGGRLCHMAHMLTWRGR